MEEWDLGWAYRNGSQNLIEPIYQLATTSETITGMLEFKNGPGNRRWIQEIPLSLMYCLWTPRKLETRCWYSVAEHSCVCVTFIASVKEPTGAGKVVLSSSLPFRSRVNVHIWWKVFQTQNSSCKSVCEMWFSVFQSLQHRRCIRRKWE